MTWCQKRASRGTGAEASNADRRAWVIVACVITTGRERTILRSATLIAEDDFATAVSRRQNDLVVSHGDGFRMHLAGDGGAAAI